VSKNVGIIGCGNISEDYLRLAPLFPDLHFVACASRRRETANARARAFGIAARSVEQLLASDDVDIVLNLTVPAAHAEIAIAAIEAGKHVYLEKPLATDAADGRRILRAAAAKGVRVGTAPDTVLGAAVQTARRLIDGGAIGRPLFGLAATLSHGMEHRHPDPEFFYKPGGGPVLDFGPYYIAALVTLLGPVVTVTATGQIGNATRTITAPSSRRRGEIIVVETLTTVQGLLGFASGARVSLMASWDAWRSTLPAIELHGEDGSIQLPNPNWFGGELGLARRGAAWEAIATDASPAGRGNFKLPSGATMANYRGLGLADMARAIEENRPHRANGAFAQHVLAVMSALIESATSNRTIAITESCERPAALGDDEAAILMRPGGANNT